VNCFLEIVFLCVISLHTHRKAPSICLCSSRCC